MKIDYKHPSRAKLIEATRRKDLSVAQHLEKCESCHTLFDLFCLTADANLPDIIQPPEELLIQHAAIPQLYSKPSQSRVVVGHLVFDSWADQPAVQLRDAARGLERRLEFKAGSVSLDLVAERSLEGWVFMARVYDKSRVSSEFILQVGKSKLLPGRMKCFSWTAKRPPRVLRLISSSSSIEFETLRWKV